MGTVINYWHYHPEYREKEDSMVCKFCNSQLGDGISVCPNCGANQDAGSKRAFWKRNKLWVLLVCAAAVLAVGAGVWYVVNDGWTPKTPDATVVKSYSVSDEKALEMADRVVATIEGKELTNGELQVYYWIQFYEYYANSNEYGSLNLPVDVTIPLDQQCVEGSDVTWQQYFVEVALNTWKRYQTLALSAEKEGMTLDELYRENLDTMAETMEELAQQNQLASADALIAKQMGPGARLKDYIAYMEAYYWGLQYFDAQLQKLNPTEDEVRKYYEENADYFASSGLNIGDGYLVDVRHILITPEGGQKDAMGNVTYSDAEWKACEQKAQSVLNLWLDGERTEESFALLAEEHSADGGSSANGGLYESVYQGYMVENFDKWCFDESREPGDYGLVKTNFGYHVMFFADSNPEWYVYTLDQMRTETSNKMVTEIMDSYEMDVKYKRIGIGSLDLS